MSDYGCGEYKKKGKKASGFEKRHKLMKQCKELGIPFEMKWDNKKMEKEIADARQARKAPDGQGKEEEGNGPEG
jgi:hypothetical protein